MHLAPSNLECGSHSMLVFSVKEISKNFQVDFVISENVEDVSWFGDSTALERILATLLYARVALMHCA